MTEDELRRVLHDEADRVEVGDDSWSRIESRLAVGRSAGRSPIHSALRPAIAIVLAAALLGGALIVVRNDSSRPVATGRGGGRFPRQIVAITNRSRLVVIDAGSGHMVRTLAHDVATFRGSPELGASPDGSQIYYTSVAPPTPGCNTSGIESIFRVPRRGGRPVVVGHGRTLAVNPIAGAVAFSRGYENCRFSGPGALEIDGQGGSRLIREASPDPRSLELLLFNLAWSNDGTMLTFDWARDGSTRPYELDLGTATSMDDAVCLCSGPPKLATFGFLGGSTDHLGSVASGGTPSGRTSDLRSRVVAVGRNGSVDRTLFRWPFSVSSLSSDPSGADILMTSPTKPFHRSGFTDVLYRWRRGDTKPTKIRDGIVAAAWIPDPPIHRPYAPAPDAIVAVRTGSIDPGPTVVLDSETGQQRFEVMHNTAPVAFVGATTKGSKILFSPPTPPNCANDGGTGVQWVPTAGGQPTRIVSGSIAPVANLRGLTAYGIVCDGPALGFTDLRTGENYRSDPLGDRHVESSVKIGAVEPLGWSPDGNQLLYRLQLRGDTRPHFYVGSLWPAVAAKKTTVVELPIFGVGVTAAAFVGDHRVAIAQGGSRTEIRLGLVDHRARKNFSRVLFTVVGPVSSLIVDRSGRHFLAIVGDSLYRWDQGDRAPRKIADGIDAATWLGTRR